MSYKINNIALSTFGITPMQKSEQSVAVAGVLDYPSRKGDTEHSWGTETEAFVDAADIEFEGRKIVFFGIMKAISRSALLANYESFVTLCKSNLLQFETIFGTFPVVLTGEIKVEEKTATILTIQVNFYQFTVSFPSSSGTASGGVGYLLSGYNLLDDFGIKVLACGGRRSTPIRIGVGTTANYIISAYREPRNITLQCIMKGATISDLTIQMGKFQKLLSSAGFKTLTFPDGTVCSVYIKDGFEVSIYTKAGVIGQFSLILREP